MANEKRLINPTEYKAFLERYIKELYEVDAPMIAGAVERCLQKLEMQPSVDDVVIPPVKIGDTAYFIINKKIYEAKIVLINWSQYRYTTDTEIRGEVQRYHTVYAKFSDWGKSVFSTMQEAKTELAKIGGDGQ